MAINKHEETFGDVESILKLFVEIVTQIYKFTKKIIESLTMGEFYDANSVPQ